QHTRDIYANVTPYNERSPLSLHDALPVSSFGMSGTNAHVIVEQGTPKESEAEPENDGPPGRPAGPWPWVFSARGTTALRAQAARIRDHVRERPGTDPVDTGWSLATTRS